MSTPGPTPLRLQQAMKCLGFNARAFLQSAGGSSGRGSQNDFPSSGLMNRQKCANQGRLAYPRTPGDDENPLPHSFPDRLSLTVRERQFLTGLRLSD